VPAALNRKISVVACLLNCDGNGPSESRLEFGGIGGIIGALSRRGRMRRIPLILAVIYLTIFTTVLLRNVYWSIGDQTDVIYTGIAAFPLGLILSLFYPGERNGAFICVSVAAVLNAVLIFYVSRWTIRRFSK